MKSNQIFDLIYVSLVLHMNIYGGSSKCERLPGHGVVHCQIRSSKCEIWGSSKCKEGLYVKLFFSKSDSK